MNADAHPSDPSDTPTSDNRPIAYLDADGTAVYRASSVGRPMRCLAAARQGFEALPAPQYLIEAAEAGSRYEPIVIHLLREQGWEISGTQGTAEIELRADPRLIVRGHLDALHAIDPTDGTDRMLEVKSMSARVWDEWQRWRFAKFPTYAAQLTTYMEFAGRPAVYAVINRETEELEVMRIEHPPVPFSQIVQKVLMAEALAAMEQLPVCSGGTEYTCPYDYLCDRREIYFAELESGDDELLLRAMEGYREAKRMEAEIKARIDEFKFEIREILGGREKAAVGGWRVSDVEAHTRRLDEKRLREALGQELDGYYTESSYRQLRVTPPKRDR